jgi:hypothetical protein
MEGAKVSISISPALVWFAVNAVGWSIAIAAFLWLLGAIIRLLIYILKNRAVFGCARAYATTKKHRAKADKYTYLMFSQVADIWKRENPSLYNRIGKLFTEQTDDQP